MSVNKVILVGNLGNDPEVRYTANGLCVANVSVATSEVSKDKGTGEKKTITEWHKVVFFGDLAEIVNKWLKKGSTIYVEGRLKTDKYQDQQGNDRYTTKVIADTMRMLGSKSGDSSSNSSSSSGDSYETMANNSNQNSYNNNSSSNASSGSNEYSREPLKQTAEAEAFNDNDIPF